MRRLLSVVLLVAACLFAIAVCNVVHSLFFPVRVVLYDALLDVFVAIVSVSLACVLFGLGRARLSPLERTLSLAVGALFGVIYAFAVPAIVDRSLSIYLLEKLDQRGGGIQYSAMPQVFIDEYVVEHRLMDIRVTEQLNSGTIGLKDGCVFLTARGKALVLLTRFYRTNFLPKKREIMGEFTDALTDPFRNSVDRDAYKCAPKG